MDQQLAAGDDDSTPNSISNTKNWLNWNGDLDHPIVSQDNWEADDESDIEQENIIEDPETPAWRDVSTTPIDPGIIRLSWRSNKNAE
jgi:hypothetical protein